MLELLARAWLSIAKGLCLELVKIYKVWFNDDFRDNDDGCSCDACPAVDSCRNRE